RREGRPHVVRGRQGAVRLHGEPLVGQAAVVGEEHDQPLGGSRGHVLRLGLTLHDGRKEWSRHTSPTKATEKNSAIECLFHGRDSLQFPRVRRRNESAWV